jgi:hypothetical protein
VVPTAVVTSSSPFGDIAAFSLLKINWCFAGKCSLCLQGRIVIQARNQYKEYIKPYAGFFLVFIFYPEDVREVFLRNFS